MSTATPRNKTNAAAVKKAAVKASSGPAKPAAPHAAADNSQRKKDKPGKLKVVRDSFTIPKTEYTQIADLKKRALALGLETRKSELIRAGLLLLTHSSDLALRKVLGKIPTLKTGRPGKD